LQGSFSVTTMRALVLMIVFVLEQPECFLCAQLSHTSEPLDPEAIQQLDSLNLACA
jgi:hypothetical protein